MKLLLAMFFFALAGTACGETLYRCKQGGQMVFSERPCGKAAETVKLPGYTPAPAAPAKAADEAAKSDDTDKKAAAKTEEKAPAKATEKKPAPGDERPPALSDAQRGDLLAKLCVDKYRPHLAYPNGVRIAGHRFQKDGFGETIFVDVRTLTNPNTPARYDPVVLNETFTCRTDGMESIDERKTEDYIERHKRGVRTDTH